MGNQYDFSGWATRANLKCSDGRTILKDAFKHHDGQTVPLVWNHQHNDPFNFLGHALLESRDEGVYAYCTFNDTESGKTAKELVQHGDICALSIYADQLKQQGGNVMHGAIREVSLVLAGANPGAYIDAVICHSADNDEGEFDEYVDEAIIYTGEKISLAHADSQTTNENKKEENNMGEEKKSSGGEKTVAEVFETLTEEQKTVVYALIGQALEDAGVEVEETEKGDKSMKHNIFDPEETNENVLSHSDVTAIFNDAKRYGSLKESFLQHTDYAENTQDYGLNGMDWLFPEDTNLNKTPEFIKRDTGWVSKVMTGVHHTPFSRIKSMFADITEDEARAKGYFKGNLKKEEVFSLLKRSTTPTTIYKKQKLDRDDVVDITDFDVVAWIKSEMRMMLDEEIARAILVGDGRLASSDDKINEANIRPIWKDEDLFTIKAVIDNTIEDPAKAFIRAVVKSRKNYKGSGEPTLYASEDLITDCMLLEDRNGRVIYDTMEKLKAALRVKDIVTVPVMEGLTRTDSDGVLRNLMALIVNLRDYNVGADKGGAVNMFDDFDIDYNAQKYLIETRCSGALIKPYSAIAVERRMDVKPLI